MCQVGYLLGLGDRHPSNLMLDRYSGKLLHIDFGDCFEASMHREKFPEKVPFRLTRMMVKGVRTTLDLGMQRPMIFNPLLNRGVVLVIAEPHCLGGCFARCSPFDALLSSWRITSVATNCVMCHATLVAHLYRCLVCCAQPWRCLALKATSGDDTLLLLTFEAGTCQALPS